MPTKVCLDLFAGLGGFSAAFRDSDEWDVVTVEIDESFDPDVVADVFDLRPMDVFEFLGYERDEIDLFVVLASPPCTQFSFAASRYERFVDGEPQTDAARDAVGLVYHTIGLIKALSPDWWYLENPQGWLRHVIGDPTGRVTFCQYGESYMKPTDLWGDHPPGFSYLSCSYGDDCHAYNTDQEHGGLGNCAVMDDGKRRTAMQQTTSGNKSAERAKVPYDLSESIRDAVDAEYANPTPTQPVLEDFC